MDGLEESSVVPRSLSFTTPRGSFHIQRRRRWQGGKSCGRKQELSLDIEFEMPVMCQIGGFYLVIGYASLEFREEDWVQRKFGEIIWFP